MIFGIIPPYTNHLISVKTVIPGQIHRNPIFQTYGYGSIPINTIFSGMNIHLPAILMFTRGTRFWHTAICWC